MNRLFGNRNERSHFLPRFFPGILVCVAVLTLQACATVSLSTAVADSQAKKFATKDNVASIYIYRNEFFGAALSLPVFINQQTIGETAAKTYFQIEVSPGSYTIGAKANDPDAVKIQAQAGQRHFIWQEVKMGLLTGSARFHVVDTAQGQAGVLESQLIASQVHRVNSNASNTPPAATKAEMAAPDAGSTTPISKPASEPASEPISAPVSVSAPQNVAMPRTPTITTDVASYDPNVKIEKVPFAIGVSSLTVERLAKQAQCRTERGAGLIFKKGPVEVYRVQCEDGRELKARCELRQCELFKPNAG